MHIIKEKFIVFSWVTLGAMLVLMVIGGISTKAMENTQIIDAKSYVEQFCFDGKFEKLDTVDMTNLYVEKTNAFFDQNTEVLMKMDPKSDIPAPDLGDYSKGNIKLCGAESDSNNVNMTCRAVSVCLSTDLIEKKPEGIEVKNNPSPYCVGVLALGFTPERYEQMAKTYATDFTDKIKKQEQLKYSYFCYKAAMERKRNDILDGTVIGILNKCDSDIDFENKKEICSKWNEYKNEKNPAKKKMLEQQIGAGFMRTGFWGSVVNSLQEVGEGLGGTIGIDGAQKRTIKKVKFVDDQIIKTKQVLDQTLDVYSQLRTAWAMHQKYMEVFKSLVKYRDEIVRVREKTDLFPSRFVDASTTKCK